MITFKSKGTKDVELYTAEAVDLLCMLNRPAEARLLEGMWRYDTLVEIRGRIIRLRNIEESIHSLLIHASSNYLEDLYAMINFAIPNDTEVHFE